MKKITPFLWFDSQAEEAAQFYVSVFSRFDKKNSKMGSISRYNEAGAKASGRPAGSAMTVAFKLNGQDFVALNGGPMFKFTEAASFVVNCKTQKEIDYFWEKLSEGGDEKAQQCGWLKDKYGLSWQVVPTMLSKLLQNKNAGNSRKVMEVFMQMKKFDIKKLQEASRGT